MSRFSPVTELSRGRHGVVTDGFYAPSVSRLLLIANAATRGTEEASAVTLLRHLSAAGHEVVAAPSAEDGLRLARAERPDLVLVDDERLGVEANEVCRRVAWDPVTKDIPVVIISEHGREVDRIVGLELGAEDYVVKPYSMRELVLRVRAILRHRVSPAQAAHERFGLLRIDPEAHRVWVDQTEVHLTVLELRLLMLLYASRGHVLLRAKLLRDVWGPNEQSRALDTCVKRLRKKLTRVGHYIETVRGVGYRFREYAD